jgi:hypothetical protein
VNRSSQARPTNAQSMESTESILVTATENQVKRNSSANLMVAKAKVFLKM